MCPIIVLLRLLIHYPFDEIIKKKDMQTYIMKCWAKSSSFIIFFASLLKQSIFRRRSRIRTNIICTFLHCKRGSYYS